MSNPITDFGQEFLDSGLKGIEVQGLVSLFQQAFDNENMPILVVERRNKIYMLRKDEEQ